MKDIFISYFNNIRNFKQDMLPLSTALFDPKWYHDGKGQEHVFVDKRNVVNGLRLHSLIMPLTATKDVSEDCQLCGRTKHICSHMEAYYRYLDRYIRPHKDLLLKQIDDICKIVGKMQGMELTPVLLVHEKPETESCERPILRRFFKELGIELKEL